MTYPALIVNDLVSVQPLTGPTGLIFYLKFVYGSNKGAITATDEYLGDNVANFDETFSSDTVKNEVLAAGDGMTTVFGGAVSFDYFPVRNSTVTVSWTAGAVARTATDNGAGVLTGVGLTVGAITVGTGAIPTLTFAVAPDLNTNITVTYRYNNEANTLVPINLGFYTVMYNF